MTNILEKELHNIKVGTTLVLNNKSFPYPPFHDYDIVESEVNYETKTETNLYLQEGASIKSLIIFNFNEVGTFNIKIKGKTYNDLKIHSIKVVVEKIYV